MRRRGNEKTQEISGHRIIVFGGQFANPADRGLFLAQAKFWFGPSVAPIAIGADRAPKRVTKLSRNRLGKIVGHVSSESRGLLKSQHTFGSVKLLPSTSRTADHTLF